MKAKHLGLGALVAGALISCNQPKCGDGALDAGEQCDDGANVAGDGCSDLCVEEPAVNLDCPRLVELPKFCVPLPNSGEQLTEVGPNDNCGAGFFPEQSANDEAFVVRKLFADTILIKETNAFTGEIPVMVLFLGEGKALLYDTGHVTGAVADVVTPFLQGRTIEVINTHLHGDHINNNSDFDVIAIDEPVVQAHCGINDASFDTNQAAVCNNAANFDPDNFQTLNDNETYRVVRVVRDGHKIDLGNGRQIEVLFTPGHSQTSTTLHDPFHRLLFTGDTLYPDDEIPLVHPQGANGADYLETAQRYADLEIDIDIAIGAHSQGVMPARVLGQFLTSVQNQQDNLDPDCDSGGFSFINFP